MIKKGPFKGSPLSYLGNGYKALRPHDAFQDEHVLRHAARLQDSVYGLRTDFGCRSLLNTTGWVLRHGSPKLPIQPGSPEEFLEKPMT